MSPRTLPSALTVTSPYPGMHVVLDEPVYRHVTGHGRDILLRSTDDDIAHEPLFICLRGKGQEDDESEDNDGDGKHRQSVDPREG